MSYNEPDSSPLLISTLCIYNPQSRNSLETVVFNAGDATKEIRRTIAPGERHQESFNPPLEVPLDAKMSVSVNRKGRNSISLSVQEVLSAAKEEDGKQLVYRKANKNVELVIGIQSPPSTANGFVATCPRFRVLIIGESGVGKSSLIKKALGVTCVDVCDSTRGESIIEQEHIAPIDDRFIVHDSCGFEAAEEKNLTAARNFISERRCKRELKDQLHAVWLCLEIPFAGGRLLESAAEQLLRDRKEMLGNIPLIVVFSKQDLLIHMIEVDALADNEVAPTVLNARFNEQITKLCLTPVEKITGGPVPHVIVSSKDEYEHTLIRLRNETVNIIETYAKNEAAQNVAMARRNDSKLH